MTRAMKRVVLRACAKGTPGTVDFAVETAPMPAAGPGEVLVKTCRLSLDPLIRFAIDEKRLTGRAQVDRGDMLHRGAVSRVEGWNRGVSAG